MTPIKENTATTPPGPTTSLMPAPLSAARPSSATTAATKPPAKRQRTVPPPSIAETLTSLLQVHRNESSGRIEELTTHLAQMLATHVEQLETERRARDRAARRTTDLERERSNLASQKASLTRTLTQRDTTISQLTQQIADLTSHSKSLEMSTAEAREKQALAETRLQPSLDRLAAVEDILRRLHVGVVQQVDGIAELEEKWDEENPDALVGRQIANTQYVLVRSWRRMREEYERVVGPCLSFGGEKTNGG